MLDLIIRIVLPNEIEALQKISKQTFYESFSSQNTEENMSHYLNESLSVEKLKTELNTADTEFYFAIKANRIIGYLKINFGNTQTEVHDIRAIEIERIYILTDFQGLSIGQILLEKVIFIAEQRNATSIWLGVWEENKRAIRFYLRNGFEEFDQHIFQLGNDPQSDIMMKLNLNNN